MENQNKEPRTKFFLNEHCMGFAELKNNCWNFSISSVNPKNRICVNEYLAGYVQGKLQGNNMLKASRNNTWDNAYLCNAKKSYPKQLGPTSDELLIAERILTKNYHYLLTWIRSFEKKEIAKYIERLLYRMFGIYEGAVGVPVRGEADLEEKIMYKEFSTVSLRLGYKDAELSF